MYGFLVGGPSGHYWHQVSQRPNTLRRTICFMWLPYDGYWGFQSCCGVQLTNGKELDTTAARGNQDLRPGLFM